MIDFLHWIKEYWFFSLSVFGVLGTFVWLKLDSRYAKKSDINDLHNRVTKIEDNLQHLPTAQDFNDLKLAVKEMNGESKAFHSEVKAEVKGLSRLVGLLVEKEVKE